MAAQGLDTILQAFLGAVNDKKWDEVNNYLRPSVTVAYDENPETRDDFVKRLTATADRGDRLSADSWTIDEAAQTVGARLVTSAAEGTPAQVWDLVIVSFEDGKIARFYQIASKGSRDPRAGTLAPELTSKPSGTLLSAGEIDARYREYIFSYNEGAMHTVMPRLWSKVVSFNGNQAPLEIAVVVLSKILLPVIAGLKYQIEEVAVDAGRQRIAVRLSIEGVPENEYLQKGDPGEKVKVYEHAIYALEDGKFSWGWSSQAFDTLPLPALPAGAP
ncbi:Snoa-like polyketide cyclase [Colletotrichum tabaci]|uniref:Snoa-like polyketide cyclase n=1 Tax=Colletotrichum tabaci TaxID=1209068 RepID=A0AAV9SU13_9PEZI